MLSCRGIHGSRLLNRAAADECAYAVEETPPAGFIHPDVLRAVRDVLFELGADLDALVGAVGLDPRVFEVDHASIPFTDVGRLIALAARRTRCSHLGLLVGQRITLDSLGPLGVLLRNCASVGDALKTLEVHACLRDRGATVGLGVHGDIAVFSYAPHEPEAEGATLHLERALATMTNILRALCGADWSPLEVLLPRSAPRDRTHYTRILRAPVRFDQETAALVLPADLLKQAIAGADPAVRLSMEVQVRRLKADRHATVTDSLREYLQIAVTRQRCKAERVARAQLVNRRTLSRHLQAEGTSFRRLANEAQFRVAQQLLVDTTLALGQISAALDFSEPAAFTHAFRRWSGMTPSAWRTAHRPKADLS
jgi:AraC-like DNA-binding protein